MSVQGRIGELLRRRQGGIVERYKSRVLAESARRDPDEMGAKRGSIVEHVPELLEAIAQAIATGGEVNALKTELTARTSQLVEFADGASEIALEFVDLRAALYDELLHDWPDMTAEAWWPIGLAIDSAVSDIIRRSDALRAKKLGALEETIRLQDRLIAILGHDLRSSLNAISGFAQLLQREIDDAQQRRPMQRILRIVDRMDHLIGYVLDLARARSGLGIALCFDRVDFNELCRGAVNASERANPGRVRLASMPGEAVDCDAHRMSQVVSNLLANALATSFETSTVDVRTCHSGGEATLAVRYERPPMPKEDIAQAFDPFRSDRRPADLGLCVAHEIVVAHRGTLEIDSAENGETTFTLRIPRTQNGSATS